jgi:uncharacterized membrane protein
MNKELLVVLTAATPVLELRGAIPLGLALGLPVAKVYILALIGNMLPIPIILTGITYVLSKLKMIPSIHLWIVGFGEGKGARLSNLIQRWGWLGLIVFVAIPLPGTGAWTGALAAVFLGLRFWSSFLAILIGVIIAGLLVSGLGIVAFSL